MTLRNALGQIALDSSIGTLITRVTGIGTSITDSTQAVLDQLRKIQQSTTYARTTSDALRINVENQASVTIYTANNSGTLVGASVQPGYYSNNAWNIQDAREIAREASEMHFAITRQRWTIT